MAGAKAILDHVQFGFRRFKCRAGPKPGSDRINVPLVRAIRIELCRKIQFRGWVGLIAFRQNTQNGIWLGVEQNRFADDTGVAAQAILPGAEREHHEFSRIRKIFLRRKGAAKNGADSEDVEETGRDVKRVYWLRPVRGSEVDGDAEIISGHGLERLTLPPCHELRDGNGISVSVGIMA